MVIETDQKYSNSTPWLIRAKVTAPKYHVALAQRDVALEKLSNPSQYALSILEAPGGFGKSTLLALWRSRLIEMGYQVAWLTAEEDETAGTLAAYLTFSFDTVGVGDSHSIEQSSQSDLDPFHQANLLSSQIQASGKKLVLIIDDVENLLDEQARQLLNNFIRHAPENLHVALAYRQNPGLALSKLVLDGLTVMLSVDDLRFSFDEAAGFFEGFLSKREAKAMYDKTEGWPVALRLMKNAIGGTGAAVDKLQFFTSEHGLASDYLEDQFFSRLSVAEKAFLLDAAILEWIELPLLDDIRQTNDSEATLSGLTYLEGIIVPLDTQEKTYRLHGLFRQYLKETLQRESIDRYHELHRHAAHALAGRGRLLTALRHAAQAHDNDLVGHLLEKAGGVRLWLREGMTRVVPANEMLNDDVIDKFPRLGFLRCIVLIKQGHLKGAQDLFNHLAGITEGFKQDRIGGNNRDLHKDHIFVRSMLAAYGCVPLSKELIADLLPSDIDALNEEATTLGHHKTLLCLASHQQAEFANAWRFGKEAAEHFRTAGSRYGELFIGFHFGSIAMVRGEVEDADNYYVQAQKAIRQHFPRDNGLRLINEILTAELDLERNRINRIRSKLSNIIDRLHGSEAWFDIYAAAYSVVTEATLYEESLDNALDFLNAALDHTQQQGLAKLNNYLVALKIQALINAGRHEQALLSYERSGLPDTVETIFDPETHTWREVESFACALINIRTIEGSYDEAKMVVDALYRFTTKRSLVRPLIRCLVLTALLQDRNDDKSAVMATVAEALKYAKNTDYIRPFVRRIADLKGILRQYQAVTVREDDRKQIERLFSFSADASDSANLVIAFSPREVDILEGLNAGLQDKMIARRLGVTPHAVRYHLKNIYAKTNANNRMQAVNKARAMGFEPGA